MPELDDSYGAVTARYYDAAYASLRSDEDIQFYLALAREARGPVLELGCGTGRVLLEIAAAGFPCTGLDASQAMLRAILSKSPPPTLRLVRAPMQDFDLGSDRFALIYSAFRAFQHLYTVDDQLGCLACVRRHLAPGGIFAFDVFNPRLGRIAVDEEAEQADVSFEIAGDTITRYVSVTRDRARQLMDVRMRYERRSGEERIENETTTFQMRWFYRYELEHLMARAGFERVELFGDFDRGPCGAETPSLVVVAR